MDSVVLTRFVVRIIILGFAYACTQACTGAGPPVEFPRPTLTHFGRLNEGRNPPGTYSLAFSPDGRTIATAPNLKAYPGVTLWEVASLRPRAVSDPKKKPYAALLAFPSASRRLLVIGDIEPLVCDIARFRVVTELPASNARDGGPLGGPAISPDGHQLAHLGYREPVLWDLAGRRREGTLIGFKPDKSGMGCICAAFSPDGKTLATGAVEDSRTVHLWNSTTRRHKQALEGHEGYTQALAFSPCGQYLAAGAGEISDRVIRIHDLRTGKLTLRLKCYGGVAALAFSPDGSLLAAGIEAHDDCLKLSKGRLQLWLMPSGRRCVDLSIGHRRIAGVAFSSDGSLLAIGGGAGLDTDIYRVVPSANTPVASRAATRCPTLHDPPRDILKEWDRLADVDPKEAWRATVTLEDRPKEAAALIAMRMKPAAKINHSILVKQLAALDSRGVVERNKAEAALRAVGEQVRPCLCRALKSGPSPEVKRRLVRLLAEVDGPLSDPQRLREVRAVEVLEAVGTIDAKAVLSWLASGAPEARITLEANWALHRLAKKTATAKRGRTTFNREAP